MNEKYTKNDSGNFEAFIMNLQILEWFIILDLKSKKSEKINAERESQTK